MKKEKSLTNKGGKKVKKPYKNIDMKVMYFSISAGPFFSVPTLIQITERRTLFE